MFTKIKNTVTRWFNNVVEYVKGLFSSKEETVRECVKDFAEEILTNITLNIFDEGTVEYAEIEAIVPTADREEFTSHLSHLFSGIKEENIVGLVRMFKTTNFRGFNAMSFSSLESLCMDINHDISRRVRDWGNLTEGDKYTLHLDLINLSEIWATVNTLSYAYLIAVYGELMFFTLVEGSEK